MRVSKGQVWTKNKYVSRYLLEQLPWETGFTLQSWIFFSEGRFRVGSDISNRNEEGHWWLRGRRFSLGMGHRLETRPITSFLSGSMSSLHSASVGPMQMSVIGGQEVWASRAHSEVLGALGSAWVMASVWVLPSAFYRSISLVKQRSCHELPPTTSSPWMMNSRAGWWSNPSLPFPLVLLSFGDIVIPLAFWLRANAQTCRDSTLSCWSPETCQLLAKEVAVKTGKSTWWEAPGRQQTLLYQAMKTSKEGLASGKRGKSGPQLLSCCHLKPETVSLITWAKYAPVLEEHLAACGMGPDSQAQRENELQDHKAASWMVSMPWVFSFLTFSLSTDYSNSLFTPAYLSGGTFQRRQSSPNPEQYVVAWSL